MRLLARIAAHVTSAQSIARGADLTGSTLWTSIIPGFMAHHVVLSPQTGSVYVSDGWGVFYAALKFHRYDLTTGRELASVRTGTSVRCLAFLEGGSDLIAVTDKKLFRLDAISLAERQRWDKRMPRYSNTMAVRGLQVVVADWLNPKVALIDLISGGVRRRAAPAMTMVVDGPGDPLLVGGALGGVWAIDTSSGRTRPILETPPALDAALADGGSTLWLLDGVRALVKKPRTGTTQRVVLPSPSQGAPTRTLRSYPLDQSGSPAIFVLPLPAQSIVAGRRQMWAAFGRSVMSIAMPVGSEVARVWTAPSGHVIAALAPDSGLVLTVQDQKTDPATAELTCVRLAD